MSRAFLDVSLKTLLSAAIITALAACNREPPSQAADAPAAAASAPAAPVEAAPYQRPTAEQLYALVAPIALFPDNLVAQTLAASTHPDQVDGARQFLRDNSNLTGAALIDAADSQPWDPSVKSLVAFPAVLDQMANNGDWTDALGQAYANNPSDVMNAIQVMRSRAQAKGNLKSTSQQKVHVVDRGAPVSQTTVVEEDEIVGPPAQTIEIEPSDPGVVYVPQYDPDEVYGEPVYSTVYETRYVEPAPRYRDAVIVGAVAFGTGILVGELFAHHEHHDRPWGWDSWHSSWGGYHDGGRPAVVYDNHPYVVNRTVVNNRYVDRSVHIDNRHNFGNTYNRPGAPPTGPQGVGAPPPGAPRFAGAPQAFGPRGAAAPAAHPAQPDYAHMQRPNFAPGAMHATAPNARPALPPERPNTPNVAQGARPFAGTPQAPGQIDRGERPQAGHPIASTNPALARPVAAAKAAPQGQPPHPTAHVPQTQQMPHENLQQPRPEPQAVRAQPQAPRTQPQPDVTRMPQMPRNEPQRFQPQQPEQRREAPRPMPQPEQHIQAPREMQRPMPQPHQEPRPQPQEHHEQQRPAPQQQQRHHDDHKKDD
ncbi:MAG TPA: DUF3300 domain-containing protein [Luteibacter sp.]|jgi:hypothetical protein|uniref:DUF3300 domain-containing protein n=1 Tax=Luteibacter sp. TaxID=1886636 RepID=UPI002F42CDB6